PPQLWHGTRQEHRNGDPSIPSQTPPRPSRADTGYLDHSSPHQDSTLRQTPPPSAWDQEILCSEPTVALAHASFRTANRIVAIASALVFPQAEDRSSRPLRRSAFLFQ